jgi:hypothetical protein
MFQLSKLATPVGQSVAQLLLPRCSSLRRHSQDLVVLGRLNPEDVDVAAAVPARAARRCVVAVEPKAAEDDGALPSTDAEARSANVGGRGTTSRLAARTSVSSQTP